MSTITKLAIITQTLDAEDFSVTFTDVTTLESETTYIVLPYIALGCCEQHIKYPVTFIGTPDSCYSVQVKEGRLIVTFR